MNLSNIYLPPFALSAISTLHNAGFEAYAVGGAVRDCLLGKAPSDWDIATDALPEQILSLFPANCVIPTGLAHGTVTVLIENIPVEITTYRCDGAYSDFRHPDDVIFTRSLREDTARRDFTVNALAYNPKEGLLDFHGGLADLRAGLLRTVGSPEVRFREDALRILRGLRFSSSLGFSLEEQTARVMRTAAPLLSRLSAERIFSELKQFLCGMSAGSLLVAYSDVWQYVLPFLTEMDGFCQHSPHHAFDVLTHTARVIDAVPQEPVQRLAALFHDSAKPRCFRQDSSGRGHFPNHAAEGTKIAKETLSSLKCDTSTSSAVCAMVLHHDDRPAPVMQAVLSYLHGCGQAVMENLFPLWRADALSRGIPAEAEIAMAAIAETEAVYQQILREKRCFSISQLALNGKDLLELGVPAGCAVGTMLKKLLDDVIAGTIPNTPSALEDAVRKKLKESI